MIELTVPEKKWIKICKLHYEDKYPFKGSWCKTLKPLFVEIYGWNPDEDNNYRDYLNCLFDKLLTLFLKIDDHQGNDHRQLKEIFYAAFGKSMHNNSILPIERAINEICGLIQCVTVIDDYGNKRFEL